MEILRTSGPLDAILLPVGGGGLYRRPFAAYVKFSPASQVLLGGTTGRPAFRPRWTRAAGGAHSQRSGCLRRCCGLAQIGEAYFEVCQALCRRA